MSSSPSQNFPASAVHRISDWPKGSIKDYQPPSVFNTDVFPVFVERRVRLYIIEQWLDEGREVPDFVREKEMEMVDEAEAAIRQHLTDTIEAWKSRWRIAKMVVVAHLRALAEVQIAKHDFEDETEDMPELLLERLFQDDFEHIWPSQWLDS